MIAGTKAELTKLATGVAGLDEILDGGLPQYSFNLIAGAPGAGKTTLVHQLLFANSSPSRPALYFTVLGEPAIKMLRYQQQMSFFDSEKVGTAIRFVDLSQDVLDGDLAKVLDSIVKHVREVEPAIVVVDSFRTVLRAQSGIFPPGEMDLQAFLQRLAFQLTSWQATTFLVGEYLESEIQDNPVFTIADGILWMAQTRDRNSVVRKLQVMKMRGTAPMPGMHTFRISADGIRVFPRIQARPANAVNRNSSEERHQTGIVGLDRLLGGGIPAGDATLISGPSGTGKTLLSTQFIVEGIKAGEKGVLAVFEEHPEDYVARAAKLGFDLQAMIAKGDLRLIYLRTLDLSADEILHEVRLAVAQTGAKRLVIDSLNGLEIALAPTFREDFRESFYRMVSGLSGSGVTIVMTVEVAEGFNDLQFSPHAISFLSQNIVFLRYIEMAGRLKRVIVVIKMRGSNHLQDICAYDITAQGIVIGKPVLGYDGLLTGVPRPRPGAIPQGLTDREGGLLNVLRTLPSVTVADLVEATGGSAGIVKRGLDRLLDLSYAMRVVEDGKVSYRAVVQET